MPSNDTPTFSTEDQYQEMPGWVRLDEADADTEDLNRDEIPETTEVRLAQECGCSICEATLSSAGVPLSTIRPPRSEIQPPEEGEPDEEPEDDTDQEMTTCDHCLSDFPASDVNQEILDNFGEHACPTCAERTFGRCDNCNFLDNSAYMRSVLNGRYRRVLWCEGCGMDEAFYCESCDQSFSFDIEHREGNYGEWMCIDCYSDNFDCNCDECMEGERHDDNIIKNWNYRPNFKFFGKKSVTDVGPFFGMEVETSWPSGFIASSEVERWWNAEKIGDTGVIYVKTDSTVNNGYEINTHPMTFEYAMTEFPWNSWDKLTDKYGAKETDASCGGHVHINKDSFTTSHLWKFIQFHHRLSDFCEIMGGRVSRDWGTLKDGTFANARRDAKKIAKEKYQSGQQRYQGLNFIPETTVELRYPAGGSSVFLMKKNLQLAHSVWAFTKAVDAKLYQQGLMDDPGYFLWWLEENQDTYPELLQFVRRSIPHPKQFSKESN